MSETNTGVTGAADIEGVILAAGFSSRTGMFKMELLLNEKTLIEHTIDSMVDFCSRVIVVGGHKIERIIEITKKYANVQVVLNPHYRTGMFSSAREGVRHVKAKWFFFTPGDYPLVKRTTYQKLLDARSMSPSEKIFIPVYQGRKGHPILIKGSLVKELLKEPKDSNLRKFINRKGFTPVEVNDDGILVDIDTLEDYEKAVGSRKGEKNNKNDKKNDLNFNL
ncbi:MAG: NTP transferase domain-containing protein [Candidatus Aminicenantes bacterium]|nr:NTP transferase domain-containing protein [Candidatus Aminicenantes bacterium]NIM83070.1 NTP transferase domain-containing protein [Candidatus Aminicenantes bacterium]NIN22449.1 NTP transferase domain-containing protein [Candidatus Aminicenantes bacterium]NIN46217.1 NTP transferase domain-containing protein [Candidatus Aminicenantes bacterium]NIN89054.1 NTP transferase domain-containing protein [Candidatus Aminicenantes bacterium]